MENKNNGYWVAGPETRAKIISYIERAKDFNARTDAFVEKVGGESAWGDREKIVGIKFKGNPGPDWKKDRRDGWQGIYSPLQKTKSGKVLAKEMGELRCDKDFGVKWKFTGLSMIHPGFEDVGNEYIITHVEDAEMPADCRRIKASEYWAMREAQGGEGES